MHRRTSTRPRAGARRGFGAACVLALLSLSALPWLGCGGGSGGGSPTDPAVTYDVEVEYLSLDLVNRTRRDEGVGSELIFDQRLADVARAHSLAMRDRGFFAHVDPEGHDFAFRLREGGVAYTVAGENLALVSETGNPAAVAHQGFLDNPVHRANVLDGRYTHGGVGVVHRGRTYWITQLFVRR